MTNSISKAQEEEMSSALIAKILAEDAMVQGNDDYYVEYSNQRHRYEADDDYDEEDNSGDDFNPKKKEKPGVKKTAKRGRKRKAIEKPVKEAPQKKEKKEGDETVEKEEGEKEEKPVKKPKKPLAEGFNSGVYSEEEEKNFLYGLETYGRDWTKLQELIKTRDGNSIRSHAQKHFIKMFRDSIPLPDKVRESGDGYTLSGKPLDPNSSAAKPYLSRMNASKTPAQTKEGESAPKKEKKASSTTNTAENKSNEEASAKEGQATNETSTVSEPTKEQQPTTTTVNTTTTTTTTTPPPPPNTTTTTTTTATITDTTNAPAETKVVPAITTTSTTPTTSEEPDKKVASPQLPTPMDMDQVPQTAPTTPMDIDKDILVDKKKRSKSATPSPSTSSGTEGKVYDSNGRTTYSTSRLRRQRAQVSINYGQITKNDDPLTLVKCEPFIGEPGSTTPGSQPFKLEVDSNVLLAMDFHAHLMTTEIIGFLAGEWDKEAMCMRIHQAFPCRSLNTGQNDVNVEMDPTSAIEKRQEIEERNMQVVGWYHSHPTFVPDPSLVDIENQRNYQMLCRDHHVSNTMLEPFVGAIVGPYDQALPASASAINWFHVGGSNSDRPVPKRLFYELKESENLTQDEMDRMFKLLDDYKSSPEKITFADYWRQDESKLQKMIKSLGIRMPWVQKQLKENQTVQDLFLEKVQANLKDW